MKKLLKVLTGLLIVLLISFTIYFGFEIITIGVLPGNIAGLLVLILALVDLIFIVLLALYKKVAVKVFAVFITIVLCVSYLFGGYYIMKTKSALTKITDTSNKIKNTVSVIVLSDSKIDSLSDLNGLKIGILSEIDTYGTKKCLADFKEENVDYKSSKYDSLDEEVQALYDKDVRAIVLNENYRETISENENFKSFGKETKVIHTTVYYTEKKNEVKAVKDITNTPFTVLISGSDSRGGLDEVARTDVNMVVTVNPNTGTILLMSIPRDYYVNTVCNVTQNCANGALDKLTHTGIYGIQTTKETVENFLGIEINYTLRVGFDAVENLVDALGGIDIYSDQTIENVGNGNTSCTVYEGDNHLNGECALGFARERYAYAEGDRHRALNQQEVIKAVIKKAMSFSSVTNYTSILDALSGFFETDLSTEEIQTLIKWQISSRTNWKVEQYSVDGTGSTEMCAALGQAAYVMIPDQNTVKLANAKINAVLKGESADSITMESITQPEETTETTE
ncbi:LCP family glycopolymer transferase [Floccifex sp.]|uniref:LCP family glycopolymer transferase n=1 Tax=Floccifex sp. TaxID=2815810 RepID=UPI003F051A80